MVKRLKKAIKKSLPESPAGGLRVGSEAIKRTKVRVIGIGGGGGSIVSEIAGGGKAASGMKKASFVVANTDHQALRSASRQAQRFQFGQNLTQGLGTGMSADLGEMAAQNEKEKIKKILEGQDLCVLVACLGGGTASGATPVFAKISKNLGNITLGIFTLPFKFEGEKKMEIAKAALEKLKPRLNAFSVIPNERVFQIIDKKTPLKQALSAINKNLAESLGGLIETIYQPGLINIDFADLRTILEGQGKLAYLNTVEVQKKGELAQETVEKVLNNPLYPYSIRGAKGVLLNITGERNLELFEVSQISKTISELVNKEAKIIFGVSHNKKYSNTIKTTLLATGCAIKIFSKPAKKRRPKKKITPGEEVPVKKVKRAKPKKIKVEVSKKPEEGQKKPVIEPPKESPRLPTGQAKKITAPAPDKVRKNALQIKQETEEAEKEMLEKETFWETPAFLRRQKKET